MPPSATAPAHDGELLERVVFEIKRVIVGQDRLVERMLVGLLARGHLLLEGVPGVAKTLAVETVARVVGGTFARLQFTPDLVPADILGTRIYRQGREEFDVELGPVVANFVLADEINRAPAKVQSAMLEVMAERHVSIGGRTFPMPDPFLVLATQNPIENEGVYPLPEAQRDRFLFKIIVDYPGLEEEREIVYRMGAEPPVAQQVLDPDELVRLQGVASQVFVHHALVDYVVRLVVATRTPAEHGLADVARLGRLRRVPARLARDRERGAGAGAGPRPRLRAAAGRARRGAGRAAAPAGAVLRRAGRRRAGRPHRRPGAGDGAAAAGHRPSAGGPAPGRLHPGGRPDSDGAVIDPATTRPPRTPCEAAAPRRIRPSTAAGAARVAPPIPGARRGISRTSGGRSPGSSTPGRAGPRSRRRRCATGGSRRRCGRWS